jgi:hypothetical protein
MSNQTDSQDLDPLPLILLRRAAIAAGIGVHEIDPIILRAIRKATGLPPIKARAWFYGHWIANENTQFEIVL